MLGPSMFQAHYRTSGNDTDWRLLRGSQFRTQDAAETYARKHKPSHAEHVILPIGVTPVQGMDDDVDDQGRAA